jgi:hypothetical protein
MEMGWERGAEKKRRVRVCGLSLLRAAISEVQRHDVSNCKASRAWME